MTEQDDGMKRVNVIVHEDDWEYFQSLAKPRGFMNGSEWLRFLIRNEVISGKAEGGPMMIRSRRPETEEEIAAYKDCLV